MEASSKDASEPVSVAVAVNAVLSGIGCRNGSVQAVSGSLYGVSLCLQRIKVELTNKRAHVFYSPAIELNYQSSQHCNSLKEYVEREGITHSNGEDVVILIDHYSGCGLLCDSVLDKLLSKTLLPECDIVLGCFQKISYKGNFACRLAPRSVEEDCNELLRLLNGSERPDVMVKYILSHCMDLCNNIHLVKLSLSLFDKGAPTTLTNFAERLILKVINIEATGVSAISSEIHRKFLSLCKLAFLRVNIKEDLDFQDVSRCLTLDIHTGAFRSMKNVGMGLLIYPQSALETAKGKCIFVHDILMEFMAAYYVACEPFLNQISMFIRNQLMLDSRLCTLYYGMNQVLSNCKGAKNPIKSKQHCVYYCLLTCPEIGSRVTSGLSGMERVRNIYKLLHESQNSDLIRKVFCKRHNDLVLKLDTNKVSDEFVVAVSYVISYSGVNEWAIISPGSLKNTADFISLKVKSNSFNKVVVESHIWEAEVFSIQPMVVKSSISKSINSKKPISMYVECMKEILQEVLQLYFPFKLQSSCSGDSSFISFLACDCLRRKLEESRVLKLEPIAALHWVESTLTKKPAKSEAPDFMQHLAEFHSMKQTTVIMMMTPLPERLYYIEPHSFIKRYINLYLTKPELQFVNGIVEASDGTRLSFGTCFSSNELVVPKSATRRSSSSQMVVPNLPIPILNDRKGVTSQAKPCITGSHYAHEMQLVGNNTEGKNDNLVFQTEMEDELPRTLNTNRERNNSLVASETKIAVETQSRIALQRPVAVDAGTVLYSTIPNIFIVNEKYLCPRENKLIKRGGNGNVYYATYGKYDFVVKKTPYRSREIEIHKILKHPNIVELKCLMFGHEQPEYRRRYFCYHFMSKYTGDLSYLVTRKPELTMVNLCKKYSGNPKMLGSIQGNWKYILKEILKGLAYMHAMNIIHRDIKASNVLIKMSCSCDVLTCTCPCKYSVCIADFDAAMTLDSKGRIPPPWSNISRYRPSPGQSEVYQVIPMGTDGFRAPETCQDIISNDVGAIDPPLTVKADIWSMGLILLKMLNGATGPSRQQKVSSHQYSTMIRSNCPIRLLNSRLIILYQLPRR